MASATVWQPPFGRELMVCGLIALVVPEASTSGSACSDASSLYAPELVQQWPSLHRILALVPVPVRSWREGLAMEPSLQHSGIRHTL